jgi:surface polysaccharide O-acyltransferase-like enzyme
LYPKNGDISIPVDLIRTVAIVLVILLHAAIEPNLNVDFMSPQGVQLWWISHAYESFSLTCVPLFIMLTGALLLQPSKLNEPIRVFLKKRWNRIGIPILFWSVIYFAWRFFVRGETFSLNSILQGLLAGPYFHFWFLYLLVGLYLLTPIIRVIVAHADVGIIKYFMLIWFLGTAIIPLIGLYSSISPQTVWFKQTVFVLTGMIGYFVLGAYVTKVKIQSSILFLCLVLSAVWTIVGTYFLVGTIGETYSQFFLDASSISVIIGSVALFLMLVSVSTRTVENRFAKGNKALSLVSQNILPIYLFHVIVLETLQKGYLGFKISVTTINPIIEIPLVTLITLLICLAIIIPLKKIPKVRRIIG